MATPKVATGKTDWDTQGSVNSHVERLMDDAAYSSAHPDDTLVLSGPPRVPLTNGGVNFSQLYAVGMVQNISVNQQKPFQPLMSVGSSRTFFVGGKAQGSAQVQRLFMNTENMARRFYHYHLEPEGNGAGVDPEVSDHPTNPSREKSINPNYMINLDSEFFLLPFGLGIIFKNKGRGGIGGFYMELTVMPNFTVAVQSGQSMIMESCTLFFDRVIPLPVKGASAIFTEYEKVIGSTGGAPHEESAA